MTKIIEKKNDKKNDRKNEPRPALRTSETMSKYLHVAISKACDPLHPNFKRALQSKIDGAKTPQAKASASQRMMDVQTIRLIAARAFDANPTNPRAAIVAALKVLKDETKNYVQFLKNLASDAAFAAHMDALKLEKAESVVDPETLDAGLDAMGEVHTSVDEMLANGDVPAFDAAQATKSPHGNRDPEVTEGVDRIPDEVLANSLGDCYSAINEVQAWLSQATATMTPDQSSYWGVDGLLPFGQRKDEQPSGEATYTPIRDFDAYREYQQELFRAKNKVVPFGVDVEAAMLNS